LLWGKTHCAAYLTQQKTKTAASVSLQFNGNTRNDWQKKTGLLIILGNLIRKGFQNVSGFLSGKVQYHSSPCKVNIEFTRRSVREYLGPNTMFFSIACNIVN